jgi:hypothetical protein
MSEKVDPALALANRVNQSLGDELVKQKLISLETKEKAIPFLKEQLVQGEIKRASLIKILCWDMKAVEEKAILDHLVEDQNLGYCNLINYTIHRDSLPVFRTNECWASMSVPMDFMEGVFFVATCHYLSEAAREHWEKRLNRDIVWLLSDLSSMTMTLEKMEKIESKELADEAERRKLRKTRSPFGTHTPIPDSERESSSSGTEPAMHRGDS